MPVSRARARAVRDKLSARMRKHPDLVKSVSLGRHPRHGYHVVLTVDTSHPRVADLPMHLDGVEVVSRSTRAARTRALVGAESFGDRPISVIRPGGPIYPSEEGYVMLAPGRYTYSNPVTHYDEGAIITTATPVKGHEAFEQWLQTYAAFVESVERQVESSRWGDGPHYIDYTFDVKEPVVWTAPPLKGLPTWIPSGFSPGTDYWVKGYRAPEVQLPNLPTWPQFNALLWGAALLGGIVLLAQHAPKRSY